jgi:hypothetical protein
MIKKLLFSLKIQQYFVEVDTIKNNFVLILTNTRIII